MNRIVRFPVNLSVLLAPSNIALTSAIPELVALSSLKLASTVVDKSRASVVFPHLLVSQSVRCYKSKTRE
jgi:hypothetical protein